MKTYMLEYYETISRTLSRGKIDFGHGIILYKETRPVEISTWYLVRSSVSRSSLSLLEREREEQTYSSTEYTSRLYRP